MEEEKTIPEGSVDFCSSEVLSDVVPPEDATDVIVEG